MIVQAVKGRAICIGRAGEQNARTVRFDETQLLKDFPGATFKILVRQGGNTGAREVDSAYVTLTGTNLDWSIQAIDTQHEGFGWCEKVAYKDGAIAKSEIYRIVVNEALAEGMEPPVSDGGWITRR